jgi:hypothetical protein
MRKMLAMIAVVVAICVLRFASETVKPAHASPAALTETAAATNEAALQELGEAIADDGTEALPGQVEPVLVTSPAATSRRVPKMSGSAGWEQFRPSSAPRSGR